LRTVPISVLKDLITGLAEPVTELIGKFVTDKDKAAQIAFEISTMAATQAHGVAIAQIEVNKQEAAHKNLFVAGWRPFIGWTCGLAMFNNFVLASYIAIVPMDLALMMPVLMGMLGLGAMRSYEKVKGVSRES
jgi:hypothetical protein